MEKLSAKWERHVRFVRSSAIRGHQSARRRAGDVSEQSAEWGTLPGRDRLGIVRSRCTPSGDCGSARGRRGNLDSAMASRRRSVASPPVFMATTAILVGLALATFLAPGRAALGVCGAGRRRFGCRHAWNRQRRQTMGRVRTYISVRHHNLASSLGHLRILRAHRALRCLPPTLSPHSNPMKQARSR